MAEPNEMIGDKIFIEKGEKLRFIVDQQIGLIKVLDQLRKRFKVSVFHNRMKDEKIFLIEEQDEDNS